MMSKRLTSALVAVALAVVLLSGTGATTAAWSDAVRGEAVTVSSGRLALEQGETSVVVVRTAADGKIARLPATTPLIPGDVVRLTSTVSVATEGDALRARLALDRSTIGAVIGDVRLPVTVTTRTDLIATGQDTWTVTPDDDGATVTAVVDLTVPATTDGRAPATDRSNWWGTRLQHQPVQPGAIRWTVVQETV